MKNFFRTLIFLFIVSATHAQTNVCFTSAFDEEPWNCNNEYCSDDAPFTLSHGIYRVPFLDFTTVHIVNDVFSNCPRGWTEIEAGDYGTIRYVVAAADGWLRSHHDDGCINTGECVNYAWLEHPNGEWTFYQNLAIGSIPEEYTSGSWITAGSIIGEDEMHYGEFDTIRRINFLVAVPTSSDKIVFNGDYGYPNLDSSDLRVPLFCNVPGYILKYNADYNALSCVSPCSDVLPIFNTTYSAGEFKAFLNENAISTGINITCDDASSVVFQSSSSVTLNAGFYANNLSTFEARIGECNGAGFNKSADEHTANINEQNEILLFPNPATDEASISFQLEKKSIVNFSLLDLTGRSIHETAAHLYEPGMQVIPIDLRGIPDGTYLCVVSIDGEQLVKKLIVQE